MKLIDATNHIVIPLYGYLHTASDIQIGCRYEYYYYTYLTERIETSYQYIEYIVAYFISGDKIIF